MESTRKQANHGGLRLDAGVRRLLEDAFDIDLASVRVHTGTRADAVARSMHADAFAVGPRLYFREGAYDPASEHGLWLLAHEVAHVIQQAHGWVGPSGPRRRLERQADLAADRITSGRRAAMGWLEAIPPHRAAGPVTIQCHASWEHRLLGDASAADLGRLEYGSTDRPAALQALRDFLEIWHHDPDHVTPEEIAGRCPGVRTLTLRASGLLVTYGELNTLPDYLSDPTTMDSLPRDILLPILQAVRQEGYANARQLLGNEDPFPIFDGAVAMHLANGTLNDIWESMWLNDLTANLPQGQPPDSSLSHTDAYSALLARNACHFAPHSWYRWAQSYDLALHKAQEAHRTGDPEAARAAWILHGYADHFLQDSFAAGHLINKTLVMQWFVEWAAPTWFEKVPDWVELQTMTTARQPLISGPGLYDPSDPGVVRDPQTAQEQGSRDARLTMSGVGADAANGIPRDTAYQNYLMFLTSTVAQSAPLALHDDLNKSGLFVASRDQPTAYQVFGDNTMLNGGAGLGIASDTAHLSQQSIRDVLDTGATTVTRDLIQSRFPTVARAASGDLLPLREWNASLKGRAFTAFESVHDIVLGSLQPRMGHVSQDLSHVVVQLSYQGKQGYLGRDADGWGRLVGRDDATRLRLRMVDGQNYYGTDDDWWLSVGTTGTRAGYVSFYWWNNCGHPDWRYDRTTKRLTSSYSSRAGMSIRDDGYVYCWPSYPAADVELQEV